MMIKLLGILGSICFGFCGIPASISTVKLGRSVGTPISIAWMIFLGSIFMYLYLYKSYGFDLLLALNYGLQVISWGFIIYYHYFPRVVQIKLSKVSFEDFKGFPKDKQDTVEKR